MLLFLMASATSLPAELGPAWAEISKNPALLHHRTVVEVGTLGYDRERKQLVYWLRKQEVTLDGTVKTAWAESSSCEATKPMLVELSQMQTPTISPPGVAQPTSLMLDGIQYRLRAPSSFGGQIEISSNVETPLANWVEASLVKLTGCWTDKVPTRVK
jgi:hypothetical protein